jgi:fluoride exporter
VSTLWWQQLALVGAGGALGAIGRFVLSGWLARSIGTTFPWGTLGANLLGSLLAGFVLVWLEGRGPSALLWRAFLMVGVLGGLTTFSALMVELWLLQRGGGPHWGGVYLAASLVGGLGLLWLGMRLAELWRS